MIDTDKYEGHTYGPWNLTPEGHIVADDMTVVCNKHTKRIVETNHKDTQLIADAPLLLEEVKRHRPPKVDGKYMAWSDSHPKHDRRTWIEQVMEGVTDVGYWTWVNWQLQYGDDEE